MSTYLIIRKSTNFQLFNFSGVIVIFLLYELNYWILFCSDVNTIVDQMLCISILGQFWIQIPIKIWVRIRMFPRITISYPGIHLLIYNKDTLFIKVHYDTSIFCISKNSNLIRLIWLNTSLFQYVPCSIHEFFSVRLNEHLFWIERENKISLFGENCKDLVSPSVAAV